MAATPQEARAAAEEIGGQVVVKAQVLTGGRGKAGGIKLADDPDDAERKAEEILGLDINGHVVRKLWIEQASEIAKEYYLSVTFDRGAKQSLFMLTTEGGVEIEEVAEKNPDALARLHVDPFEGYQPYQARRLIYGAGIDDPNEQKQLLDIIGKLYRCFVESDAMLCEINPLIVTPEGEIRALDSKFTVDDNALYKHPDIAEMRDLEAYPPEERAAREKGVTYVKLDGEVGILGNGAGLVMSTLDVIALAGGRPANFCDLGGGGDAQGVVDALEVITADPQVQVDPVQHLRRDHALRRGGARDPAGALADRDRAPDRRALRRDERRGGPGDPGRGRAAEPARRGDDARGGQARGGAGGMSAWSERAEAYRESPGHREGADLDLVVEWCEPAEGVKALDVATGGGHVARRLRELGRRGGHARPIAGDAGGRARAAPSTSRSTTAPSTSSSRGSRRTTSRTSAPRSPSSSASATGSS